MCRYFARVRVSSKLIRQSLKNDFTIAGGGAVRKLSLNFRLSASNIQKLFCFTPSRFIAQTNIVAESRLLSQTDQSVANIALACGFYDTAP